MSAIGQMKRDDDRWLGQAWTRSASAFRTGAMFQFDHGELSPDKVTLVAPIRNEMFFLPSFLDHYRALGIEQFCFIDDYSDDGSADFVKQQRDSILVRSTYRFGQRLWLRPDITGLTHWGQRAGAAWKGLFPRRFFPTGGVSMRIWTSTCCSRPG